MTKTLKQRTILLLLIAIVYIGGNFTLNRWEDTLYYGDSNGYYLHVVSFFVNQDVGDYDKTITTLREVNPNSGDPREDKYGIRLTEKGRRYIKYTLGVPVMEVPFFLIAHAYAKASPKYEANGWSEPYLFVMGFAIIFYVLIGFYLLMSVLEKYFSKKVTAFTVLAIAFATNLFFQATYVTMSHGFLFFDYCLLIFLTDRFYVKPDWKKALGIGATIGLIALTRVPEVISAFIPVLWGLSNWKGFVERIQYFLKNYKLLIAATVGFFLLFSIQITYWYYVSGHFIFDPYKGEGFNFLKPNIYKGWFDFANGWLIYTPIMGLSIIGWFILRKQLPGFRASIFAFVGLQAWIHYSYYAWTFFPGLGQRPMVETYPILAFSLAAFFVFAFQKKTLRWLPAVALVLFGALNLFQTWQMRQGVIWSERSNIAFYYETFGSLTPTRNSLRSYDSRKFQPDSSKITLVNNLYTESFEDTSRYHNTNELHFEGQYSVFSHEEFTTLAESIPINGVQSRDWIRLGVQAFRKPSDQTNRDGCEVLVLEIRDEQGKKIEGVEIKPSTHIGNPTHSIWTSGTVNIWGEASVYLRMPRKIQENWTLTAFIFNPHKQKLYLDNLRLDVFRSK